MKKLKIEYGDSVFALPREALIKALLLANGFDLKVLLLVAADDTLRRDYGAACAELCRRLDCTKSALERALNYWHEAGVLSTPEADGEVTAVEPMKKQLQSESLPDYTEGQAADIIEKNAELSGIIEMCQQIVEKMFTPAEAQIVVGLYDHLGLDGEYIAMLFAYCKDSGKRSLRYIEKTALGLYDEGIDTAAALTEHIKRKDQLDTNIGTLRKTLGIADRALTPREKKAFETWLDEWRLDVDVISRAYEVTVDKIGAYKLAYMNRVLENWHKEGLTTLQAIDAALEAYQKSKPDSKKKTSGFETDEYFEAALARSQKHLEKNKKEG